MTTYLGLALLFSIIIGGVYLYCKVRRLEREIAVQSGSEGGNNDDETR